MIGWLEKHRKIAWTLTVLIAITIFYVSSITFPLGPTKQIFPLKSVIYHFLIFFIFGFFLLICLIRGKFNLNLLLLGLILSILYGIYDEIHQIFVPNRFFDIADVLTNSAGILLSGVLYSLYCKRGYFKKAD